MSTNTIIEEMEEKFSEKFSEIYSHDDIQNALRFFAYWNSKKLPKSFIDGNDKIMLDILKVDKTNIFLSVVIRSTKWLRQINNLKDRTLLTICLHEERWPTQNRFDLVGGFCEISGCYIERALFEYLNSSVDYWKSINKDCAIMVTERVEEIAKKEKFKQLLGKVEVIKLSNTYKKATLIMPSPDFS